LADLRATRVKGAERILRSTMCLLGGVGCGGDAMDGFPPILASGPGEHKDWGCRWPGNRSGCGEKDRRDSVNVVRTSASAADP
jgi:hypothetical protein